MSAGRDNLGLGSETGQSATSLTRKPSMPAPVEIVALVKRFEDHHATYTATGYNETLLRDDFLNPFFVALGWDVDNTSGYAEAYRDVVKEEALRTDDGVKAPDFTFRIGGVRKFFVEAKKPSVVISRHAQSSYQLRRYAWSAKLPLSILVNFAEFAVYDTRVRPEKTDKAGKGRVFLCSYKELADKWDWIYATFSKDAVIRGSFDKYVEDNKSKRGTSEVDVEFLRTIEGWRSDLAHDLAKNNKSIDNKELNFAVQRIIDRIIFLRICEDRGIEDYGRLASIAKKAKIYAALTGMFLSADAKYNSGIFHFKAERGRAESPDELTLKLKIDDKILKTMLLGLYYPESPFAFQVIGADILGQVYEQFLGKVIKLDAAHQVDVEDKPAVRKAGGVYYTPSYIVEYMVRKTLDSKLQGKSPAQITKLRVLDPACGSGSFLIVAYQHFLDWHLAYYIENEPSRWLKGKRATLVQTARGGLRLTLDERRRILLTHIYGVDIDDQAVEVTKLSLLLKVLEGETEQTIQPFLSVFQERALPDLEDNIKCGNSLISPDIYSGDELAFEGVEPEKINAFSWSGAEGFPAVMRAGGFDVIVGNPPYIFTRDHLSKAETAYFTAKYKMIWDKHNTYLLFMELLLSLLAKNGVGTYIVPNSWLTIESGKLLRQTYVDRLTVLADLPYTVFNKVAMEPSIFIVAGEATKADVEVLVASSKSEFTVGKFGKAKKARWRDNGYRITTGSAGEAQEALDALKLASGTLGSVFDVLTGLQAYERGKGSPPQSADDVKNHIFDARRKLDSKTIPYLQGRDVGRYGLSWSGDFLRYGTWLSQPREIGMFTRPRILLREITAPLPYCLNATFVDALYLNNKSILNVLDPEDNEERLKALTCVLNSRLMSAFYKAYAVKSGRKLFPKVVIRNLREFPFPKVCEPKILKTLAATHDQFIEASASQANAKTPHLKEVQSRRIAACEARADDLVFQLYGASESQREAIEAGISAATPTPSGKMRGR